MNTQQAEIDMGKTERIERAKIILEQLGGNRFIAMTGAKNFLTHDDGLSFRLPTLPNYTKTGINYVRIRLNDSDLYDIEYAKIYGMKYTNKTTSQDLFCDMIAEDFETTTGLYTHL